MIDSCNGVMLTEWAEKKEAVSQLRFDHEKPALKIELAAEAQLILL